ncbi:MAG: Zn-ribbon domain-containing OB-fold protein [Acidobacteriota bacterium]|nr:Zn-ribbon domain-containing OB-fold protein [Acidobacteriota bacterium]MDQ7086866.1 Zn-ribbon domain-containing OB-fold protein [Acidobacteriota bacterium]
MIGSARSWREKPQRYRYEAAKCSGCGKVFFPPRVICDKCRGREFETQVLAGSGEIETYTVIHIAPSGFTDEAPYAVAVIRLDDGVRITAQVADCKPEDLQVGARVRREFRKVAEDGASGVIHYGYKFVPEN